MSSTDARSAGFAEGEPAIGLARDVLSEKLRESVEALAAFRTRYTGSPEIVKAAEWLRDRFRALGYADASLKPYNFTENLVRHNVVCEKRGTDPAAPLVLLGAHYDSICDESPDREARAPGANDNATGVAVVLEAARLLAATQLSHSVRFVCFSGEEQGNEGSMKYAEELRESRAQVRFVLNLDQLGCPDEDRHVVVEHDEGNGVEDNDKPAKKLAEWLRIFAESQLDILVKKDGIFQSDHMAFEARGFVVAGLTGSGDYEDDKHSDRDTPEKVDFDYLTRVAQIAVAAAAARFR